MADFAFWVAAKLALAGNEATDKIKITARTRLVSIAGPCMNKNDWSIKGQLIVPTKYFLFKAIEERGDRSAKKHESWFSCRRRHGRAHGNETSSLLDCQPGKRFLPFLARESAQCLAILFALPVFDFGTKLETHAHADAWDAANQFRLLD
jgi:hypothetical protein